LGRRKQKLRRTVRGIAYQSILLVRVTTAEYHTCCSCCQTFRTRTPGIEAKAKYTNAVREAVLDRLLEDHMSVERTQAALARDFLLELSSGFIYDCLQWKVRQLNHADYRAWTLREFSGTLCIDEIHLGRYTLLLATDPLRDFPVAFALVGHNDDAHMARFLRQLRDHGFQPRVVITDGSTLYPELVVRFWPAAEHQLCIFHVLQNINRCVLDAVRRVRNELRRQGGGYRRRGGARRRGRPRQPRRRGRPRDTAAHRQRCALKQKAQFLFRHLIVTRRQRLSPRQRRELAKLLEMAPALRVLRRFVDRLHLLFEKAQTLEQAYERHRDLLQQTDFAADSDLARALAMLSLDKFQKMVAFLRTPVGQRQRTNNHVERSNRQLRHYEKVRYRWRRPRTIVRFVVLAFHRQWRQRPFALQLDLPPPAAPTQTPPLPHRRPSSQPKPNENFQQAA
jgi:hypothetical protein